MSTDRGDVRLFHEPEQQVTDSDIRGVYIREKLDWGTVKYRGRTCKDLTGVVTSTLEGKATLESTHHYEHVVVDEILATAVYHYGPNVPSSHYYPEYQEHVGVAEAPVVMPLLSATASIEMDNALIDSEFFYHDVRVIGVASVQAEVVHRYYSTGDMTVALRFSGSLAAPDVLEPIPDHIFLVPLWRTSLTMSDQYTPEYPRVTHTPTPVPVIRASLTMSDQYTPEYPRVTHTPVSVPMQRVSIVMSDPNLDVNGRPYG